MTSWTSEGDMFSFYETALLFFSLKSTDRAITLATALVLALAMLSHKILKFLVNVSKSLYVLNLLIYLADALPDVRYWSEVVCCTILTHLIELDLTDFEILC